MFSLIEAFVTGLSARQAFFSQVEIPNLGNIYNWSNTQTAIIPNNTKSCDIRFLLGRRPGSITLKKTLPEMCRKKFLGLFSGYRSNGPSKKWTTIARRPVLYIWDKR